MKCRKFNMAATKVCELDWMINSCEMSPDVMFSEEHSYVLPCFFSLTPLSWSVNLVALLCKMSGYYLPLKQDEEENVQFVIQCLVCGMGKI